MDQAKRELLFQAWAYADAEDKSTEWMFQFMSDTAQVPYDEVVDFVINTTEEERKQWYESEKKFFISYSYKGKNQGCINVKAKCVHLALEKVAGLYPDLKFDHIQPYSVMEFDLDEDRLYSPDELANKGFKKDPKTSTNV